MHCTPAADREMGLRLFRILVEQAPDALMLLDPRGIVHVWNRKASNLFGYGANEVLGKSFGFMIRDDFQEQHWQGIHDAILLHYKKSQTSPIATRVLHKDGRQCYVDIAFSVVIDDSERVIGFMGSARDITRGYLAQCSALETEAELHRNHLQTPASVGSLTESLTPFVLD